MATLDSWHRWYRGSSGGTAGTAGTGGSDDNPCGTVPTAGECVDDNTIRTCLQPDGLDSNEPPQIIETTCPTGRVCREGTNGAQCRTLGECTAGDVQCSADKRYVRTCVGTGEEAEWQDEEVSEQRAMRAFDARYACDLSLRSLEQRRFSHYPIRSPEVSVPSCSGRQPGMGVDTVG